MLLRDYTVNSRHYIWTTQIAEQILNIIAVVWTLLVIIVMRRIRAYHPNLQAILINVQL